MTKFFFLIIVVACLGLPMNTWASFLLILIALSVAIMGRISSDRKRWRWAIGLTAASIFLRILIPSYEINEGQAVFDPDATSALSKALPPDVFESLREDYVKLGRDFKIRPAPRAWNVSMDSIWNRSALSRWTDRLSFDDRWDGRVGALNDVRHNYYRSGLNGYGAYVPLIYRFDLPQTTRGGELCWRGIVFWPATGGEYERVEHGTRRCRTLLDFSNETPLTLYAADLSASAALSMHLQGPGPYVFAPYFKQIVGAICTLAVIGLLGTVRLSALAAVFGGVAAVIVALIRRAQHLTNPSELSIMTYMERGNDGLVHYGLGREIVTALLDGRWEQAARGGENIFFFMPGLRFVWAPMLSLFGETVFGYWVVVSLLPLLVFLLARHFVRPPWLMLLMAFFLFVPLFKDLGFFQFYYARLAVRGFGGAMAWTAFVSALVVVWPTFDDPLKRSAGALFGAGLMFAIAVACRPNFAPGIIAVIGGSMIALAVKTNWRTPGMLRAAMLGLGASAVFLLTLHNWYFGDLFVPLTRSVDISVNLAARPGYYADVVAGLVSGTDVHEKWAAIIANIRIWIDFDQPWLLVAYLSLWVALLWRRTPLAIRVVTISLILNHGVFLFYRGIERYTYGLWMLSLLVFFWAWREIYWPIILRRWPDVEKYLGLPARLSGWLGKLSLDLEPIRKA